MTQPNENNSESRQNSPCRNTSCLLQTFSLRHKIGMRICLYGFFAIGIIGVLLESHLWGILYLLFMGTTAWIILNCFCSHCPYPYQHKTCLGMPFRIVTLFAHKDRELSLREKTSFITVLTIAMLFPQPFLYQRPPLMLLYWIFCLPTCIIFPAYFCRHCCFVKCPFNPQRRNRIKNRSSQV